MPVPTYNHLISKDRFIRSSHCGRDESPSNSPIRSQHPIDRHGSSKHNLRALWAVLVDLASVDTPSNGVELDQGLPHLHVLRDAEQNETGDVVVSIAHFVELEVDEDVVAARDEDLGFLDALDRELLRLVVPSFAAGDYGGTDLREYMESISTCLRYGSGGSEG